MVKRLLAAFAFVLLAGAPASPGAKLEDFGKRPVGRAPQPAVQAITAIASMVSLDIIILLQSSQKTE